MRIRCTFRLDEHRAPWDGQRCTPVRGVTGGARRTRRRMREDGALWNGAHQGGISDCARGAVERTCSARQHRSEAAGLQKRCGAVDDDERRGEEKLDGWLR